MESVERKYTSLFDQQSIDLPGTMGIGKMTIQSYGEVGLASPVLARLPRPAQPARFSFGHSKWAVLPSLQ